MMASSEAADYVQRRWKLLRDRYGRAKKSAVKHSGDEGGPPPPQWELMEAMSFFHGFVFHRKSETSLKKDTERCKPRLSLDDSSQCSTPMNVDDVIAGSPDHEMLGECSLDVVEPTASFSESPIVSAQVFDLVPCMASPPVTSTPLTETSNDHEGPSTSKRRPTTHVVRSFFQLTRHICTHLYALSISKCTPSLGCPLIRHCVNGSSLLELPTSTILLPNYLYPMQVRCYAARKGKRERMLREKRARKLAAAKKEVITGGRKFASKAQLPTRERTSMNLHFGKSADDVWIARFNSRPVFQISEAIEMHREIHHPTMLNLCDSPLYLTCELDMSLEKKNKFLDSFSGVISLPNYFDDGKIKTVLVFCKDEGDQNSALVAGADLAGGLNLVKQVQRGEVIISEFKYVVAHMDMHSDLSTIRGILKHRFPSIARGTLGVDMKTLTEKYKKGLEYAVIKDSVQHDFGWIEVPVGRLNMPAEQLEANIGAVVQAVCTHRNARLGAFITVALLTCPPSKEKMVIDISKYVPVVPQQKGSHEEDDDDEDATVAIQ